MTVAEIANKGIVFFTTAYLARIILPAGFGIISFANTFTLYFILVVNLGFNIIGQREIAKFPDKIRKYVNQITTLRLLFAIICFALMCLVTYFLDKPITVKYIIIISGFNLFANAILTDWVYNGIEKMEILALRQVATSVLNLIGILILVHNVNDIVIAMVVTTASVMINSIWMLILYIRMFGPVNFIWDSKFIKELVNSSLPVTMSNIFILIYNFINIVMLGFMRTDNETGIYSAGARFVVFVLAPSAILQGSFFPILSRSETLEQRQKVMKVYSNLMFICGAIITLGILTFSDYINFFVYGSKFIESASILKIVMLTSLFMFVNTAYFPPLVGWKMEKTVMYIIGFGALLNIILNFLFIPLYGIYGAAWVTVTCEFLILFGQSIVFKRIIKKAYLFDFAKIVALSIIACAIGWFLNYKGLQTIISGIVTLIIYVFLIFYFKFVSVSEIKGYIRK